MYVCACACVRVCAFRCAIPGCRHAGGGAGWGGAVHSKFLVPLHCVAGRQHPVQHSLRDLAPRQRVHPPVRLSNGWLLRRELFVAGASSRNGGVQPRPHACTRVAGIDSRVQRTQYNVERKWLRRGDAGCSLWGVFSNAAHIIYYYDNYV